MPDFIDDPEWRRAYRAGERAALERAYRAYVRPIERYLRSLARFYGSPELGQSSAVADFLQEVFTRAFSTSARRNYDESRAFGAYVTTIARNCFVDTLRVRGREVSPLENEALLAHESVSGTPDEGLDPRVRLVLAGYLASLPPDLKQVYEIRFAEGESQDHACGVLGMSRRTLRTKEERLRKGLRKALVRAGVSLAELRPTSSSARSPLTTMVPRRLEQ